MSPTPPSEPRCEDVEAIVGRLREELRLLDKLDYTMAAAYLSQALQALEEE